jgi:hypothetical protein
LDSRPRLKKGTIFLFQNSFNILQYVLNSTSHILTYKITFFVTKDCREEEIKKNSIIGPIKHGLVSVPVPVAANIVQLSAGSQEQWSVFSSSSSKIVDLGSGHLENHALVSILVPAGF